MLTWLLLIMLVATVIVLIAQISVRTSTERELERIHEELIKSEHERKRLEGLVWGLWEE